MESIRKNSDLNLNHGQRSSKMKVAALRCITWSSLAGLVWAMTPLVLSLSRVNENQIVHWFGNFESVDDMYVPVHRSDWDPQDEDSDLETPAESEDDVTSVKNNPDGEEQHIRR